MQNNTGHLLSRRLTAKNLHSFFIEKVGVTSGTNTSVVSTVTGSQVPRSKLAAAMIKPPAIHRTPAMRYVRFQFSSLCSVEGSLMPTV